MAPWIVRARSCAEIPVETPSRASIDTVNAVPSGVSLWSVIGRSSSSSQRSGVRQRQMSPLPWVAMNAIASGVTNGAAAVRSPSFSRSASSTTTTKRPERMSSIASSIVVNGDAVSAGRRSVAPGGSSPSAGDELLDVLREDVGFEVHRLRRVKVGERRRLERVWHECDGESAFRELGDRERDTVDGDGALLDAVAEHFIGRFDEDAQSLSLRLHRLDPAARHVAPSAE